MSGGASPLQIAVGELSALRQGTAPPAILDVRETWEVEIARLPDAIHIPLGDLAARFQELPTDRPLVVMCHHGMRSLHATQWLRGQGFRLATNLAGGIDAWAREIDPAMAVY